jgi:hypothetical protein
MPVYSLCGTFVQSFFRVAGNPIALTFPPKTGRSLFSNGFDFEIHALMANRHFIIYLREETLGTKSYGAQMN